MPIYLPELTAYNLNFPHPNSAMVDPNGLLAFGGDLQPERLLRAYQNGIFPWYNQGEPILWWSPAPRSVFYPEQFQPSKSLRKFQRKVGYRVTINQDCYRVIEQCALSRGLENTWISPDIQKAYQEMHCLGHCHSVEVWEGNTLVGGLYGIAVGRIFCGESMFSLATNASKIALWFFCRHFHRSGGQLIDCQVMNHHLQSLGAQELSREHFLNKLSQQPSNAALIDCYQPQTLSCEYFE